MRRLFACLPVARNRVAAQCQVRAVLGSAAATDRTASAIGVPDAACRRPLGLHLPVVLLVCSNVFMTLAWYGHLNYKAQPLVLVVLVSWGIAFIEYCLAVPANRFGHAVYSAAELKTIQEVVTLIVFAVFSFLFLKEPLGWNHAVGFLLIAAGAGFIFMGKIA